MSTLETKSVLFEYFWARILEKDYHISNQQPQIYEKCILTHTMNVGIGSAFSNSPGSAFSEDTDRILVWVRFIKYAVFYQFVDRRVMDLMPEYYPFAGDTKKVFSSLRKIKMIIQYRFILYTLSYI